MANLRDLLQELGYNSETELAEAIYQTGKVKAQYKSATTVMCTLSHFLNGRRQMPRNIREALVELGVNNQIIEQLKEKLKENKSEKNKGVNGNLYETFRSYVGELDKIFKRVDRDEKLGVLKDLEKICSGKN